MSKIILDDDLRAKLNGLSETIELCDANGKVLALVTPYDDFIRDGYEWAKTAFTDEELDKASREPGGRTLAEIKKSWGWA